MRAQLSILILGACLLPFGAAQAQGPYYLTVSGHVDNCAGNAVITLQAMPDNAPTSSTSVGVDEACHFEAVIEVAGPTGDLFAFTSCSNGTVVGDSTSFAATPPGNTAQVQLALSCGSSAEDCTACITVAQETGPTGPVPFSVQFSGCSSGGTPPYSNMWLLPNGTISSEQSPEFVFSGPGAFLVCLQSSDATGCSSIACDTVIVDANGVINPPDLPDCAAGFVAVQAYTDTSGGNGYVAPVPDLVWVLNTSIYPEGTGFTWVFGDGETSTETYPMHTYSGPGPYLFCLELSGDNCNDVFCQTLTMDEDGLLQGMAPDGHATGIPPASRSGGFTVNVVPVFTVGVEETEKQDDVQVWPNPVSGTLNISFTDHSPGPVPVTVMDVAGRLAMAETISPAPGTRLLRLDTGQLEPGLYLLRLGNSNRVARFKKIR